jgi:hypothetical protein
MPPRSKKQKPEYPGKLFSKLSGGGGSQSPDLPPSTPSINARAFSPAKAESEVGVPGLLGADETSGWCVASGMTN